LRSPNKGLLCVSVPPSGGSLEIGNGLGRVGERANPYGSPFGGIPRNWKLSLS